MRGKASSRRRGRFYYRITPAHAGKRQHLRNKDSGLKDHPRTCGEKHNMCNFTHNLRGSLLHMRGKVIVSHRDTVVKGITPAHAGKSAKDNGLAQTL